MSASAVRTTLPVLVVACWCATGHWSLASAESRSWLTAMALLGAALLAPLPGVDGDRHGRAPWLAWTTLLGLVLIS